MLQSLESSYRTRYFYYNFFSFLFSHNNFIDPLTILLNQTSCGSHREIVAMWQWAGMTIRLGITPRPVLAEYHMYREGRSTTRHRKKVTNINRPLIT